jgi:hypothetical protein
MEVFPTPNRCFDFGLSFVKQLVFKPIFFLGLDVTNFLHQKMDPILHWFYSSGVESL